MLVCPLALLPMFLYQPSVSCNFKCNALLQVGQRDGSCNLEQSATLVIFQHQYCGQQQQGAAAAAGVQRAATGAHYAQGTQVRRRAFGALGAFCVAMLLCMSAAAATWQPKLFCPSSSVIPFLATKSVKVLQLMRPPFWVIRYFLTDVQPSLLAPVVLLCCSSPCPAPGF